MDAAGLPPNFDSTTLSSLRLEQRASEARSADAAEAGRKLEALFATLLVKELRSALPEEGFFGSGPGADVFNGWMDEFLGEQLARDGALDLAGRVKGALSDAAQGPESEEERP